MHVRLLGNIEVIADGDIAVGGPTQRRVLAALALGRGDAVSMARLVDVLWPDGDPPDRAEHNVRTYVHRLRSSLSDAGNREGDLIETTGAGYRLAIDDDELDIARFERLATTSGRLANTGNAIDCLDAIDEATALWRGGPLAEFEHEPWAAPAVIRLRAINLDMRVRRAEMLLVVGRANDAVADLELLTRDEPLRERPRALLMRALYESGRQPEALRAFHEFRELLIDEVGTEPSPTLVDLDRTIAAGTLSSSGQHPRVVGAYELHERIGEGAFAVVHRAVQLSVGREVAIKIVRAELANRPEFIRRFEAEGQMVAAIEHSNVVPLYDFWREPDRAFLVMRWMTGGSLEQRLDRGPWPLDDTLALVDEIAAALTAAHANGIVHRDVKPANILFDDDGRSYLGDFGIALAAEERSRPEAALSEGSPTFASPEQLRRETVGPEADVHALAIVVFNMLTGHTPFASAPDEVTLLQHQLSDPIPSVRPDRPDLPAAIDDVLAIATAKRPTDRFPTAAAFATALRFAADSSPTAAVSAGTRSNPYKGLRAFTERDSGDFFGRDRLVDELVHHLRQPDHRLVALIGPSGSGKSSVVRAGLVPALREGRVPGSSAWFATTMTPGAHPFEALETALLRIAVNPPNALVEQLRDGPRGILRAVRRVLPDDDSIVFLLIDQFEELFTATTPDTQNAFLSALATAVDDPSGQLRIALTMRADFHDRPLRHPAFAALMKRNTVVATPLSPDELERAIVEPAAAVGVDFEPGLVAEISAEVNHQPGSLPLLQYALTQAFDASEGSRITRRDYEARGGLAGALSIRAEELWQGAPADEQSATRRLFGRLIALGEGGEDTRRRTRRSELGDDHATSAAIEHFGAARLLSFDRDPASREPTVEVAHEALIREWPRLRDWMAADRDTIRTQRHVTAAATDWIHQERDPSELYRGARLETAEPLLDDATVELNPDELEFLRTSVAQREAEIASERHRVRRLHRLVGATAVVAVIALIAGIAAVVQWSRADEQADAATASARLAADNEALAVANADEAAANAQAAAANADQAAESEDRATRNADEAAQSAVLAERRADEADQATARADVERMRAVALSNAAQTPTVAALLAVEAYRSEPTVESLDTLHRVLSQTPGYHGTISSGPYLGAELLADGTTVVAAGVESLDVWDTRDRNLIRRIGHASPPGTATIDVIDDQRVAALAAGRTATDIYDLGSGEHLTTLEHAGIVNDIAVAPDASRLAAALDGVPIEIWNIPLDGEQAELASSLDTGDDPAYFARWSPTADHLAVVTQTSGVQLWDLANKQTLWVNEGDAATLVNELQPFAAAFSPDGSRFAFVSGTLGGEIRTIEVSDGSEATPPLSTKDLQEFPIDAMYWIDGTTIGVPSRSNLLAYDLATGTAEVLLEHFISRASDVLHDVEHDRVVVSGLSGLELWTSEPSGPLNRVLPLSAEQRTGGAILTSLAADGSRLTVSVFTPTSPAPTIEFDLGATPPSSSMFDADGIVTLGYGEYTLTANATGVQILDRDRRPLGEPVPLPFDFTDVGASEDGRYFAFARLGGRADVYTSTGELLGTVALGDDADFTGAQAAPYFTSDGEFMTVGTTDGRSGLWRTGTLERVDVPSDLDGRPAHAVGPWFVVSEEGSFQRFDPSTFEAVGSTVALNGLRGLGYPRVDETRRRLAATGSEVTKVFDLDAGRQLGRDLPYAGGSSRVEFSADGTLLSVPFEDGVMIWNFDTDGWVEIACEMAGRNLTRQEWEQLGPRTVGYRTTCPEYVLDD